MNKDPKLFLQHMLNSIKNIEDDTKDCSKERFVKNRMVQDAVIRNIEVIGEAAKNVSSVFKRKYKDIQWNDIAGMRDKLVHGYFGVDLDIVWNVIEKDLPDLKNKIDKILKEKL